MADGIIGSVGVSVVPDAANFWRELVAKTSAGAGGAGRELGAKVRRGMEEELGRPVNVKVDANTARARAEIAALSKDTSKSMQDAQKQSSLLRDAIVLLGSAAVPVGAVVAGAMAGAIPVAATLALGVKGISDEMKSGALQGTKYGQDMKVLGAELTKVKAIAAGGLLRGVNQAVKNSGPLFRTVNGDIAQMSGQIGKIIGHAGPALLSILHDLNPLFVTFGNELVKGATFLEHWAKSTTGISSFVKYVQAELPTVEHVLGSLVGVIVHVGESLAPLGHITLTSIGVLADAINAIPVSVLQHVVPVAVMAYGAIRLFSGAKAIFAGATTGVKFFADAFKVIPSRAAASAAAAASDSRAWAASAASKVAAEKRAELAIVTARENEAAAVVSASRTQSEADQLTARAALASAEQQTEAARLASLAADAQAANAARSAESAAAVAASTRAESLGMSSLLGPIGLAVGAVGLLGLTFLSSSSDTQAAASAAQSYADALSRTVDLTSRAVEAQASQNLAGQGAFNVLDKLHSQNLLLGTSYVDLIHGVTGSQRSYDRLKASMAALGPFGVKLLGVINDQRTGLHDQAQAQRDLNRLQHQSIGLYHGQTAATNATARAMGLGNKAFLEGAAQQKKNEIAARKATEAMQLESDAAGLLTQAFDRLNGKTIDIAQARIQFAQSITTSNQALHKHADAWKLATAAGQANQQNTLSEIQAAQGLAEAVSKGTKLTKDGIATYRESLQVIKQQIIAHGGNAQALALVNRQLERFNAIHVPPTKLDVNSAPATGKIAQLQDRIASIKQGLVPNLDVGSDAAHQKIKALQAEIDAIKQSHRPLVDAYVDPAMSNIHGVQFALDHLHDKTITVTTRTVNQLASTRSSQVPGSAAGTRATFGTPYVPPNTVSTVGEAGYEGLITDSRGRASILSNAQAKAAGIRPGGPLPGFAKGTTSLLDLIRRAGFRGRAADIMYGIVEAESGGSATAHNYNPSTQDDSYGLAQLNLYGSLRAPRMAAWHISNPTQLYDPALNLRIAHQMYVARGGFSDWSTYNSGAYREFMSGYGATVAGGGITVGHVGGKKVWRYGGHSYSSLAAAQNAQASALQSTNKSRRSNARSAAGSLIGNIGQRSSPQLNIGQTGVGLVEHQIAAASARLANMANLKPKDRARFEADLVKLVKQAQKQLDKLKLHIRKADLKDMRKALLGSVADVRAAFRQTVSDLRKVGASDHLIAGLQGRESKLLVAVANRNRAERKLAALNARAASFRASVSSAISGSFDITQAGVTASGAVKGGAILAQQAQSLNRDRRFVRDVKELENRGFPRDYIMELARQGPSVLPQLEGLLSLGKGAQARLISTEQKISNLSDHAGGRLGEPLFGSRRVALQELKQDTEAIAKSIEHGLAGAVRDGLKGLGLEVDGQTLIRIVQKNYRKADRRHGVPGGHKP